MAAYYNEFDEYAAQWLRNLIAAGHIADGDVDQRSINDVSADDLANYTQCHFFAGIGVWSHALRLAGWDDDRPVWTGSCPCQPFSAAGEGKGHADERHLWPRFFELIAERKPPIVFGEQVEAAIRHGWLDLVQTDMEGIGYAFAAAGIPAAGVGAPHIRQRLFFVADATSIRQPWWGQQNRSRESCARAEEAIGSTVREQTSERVPSIWLVDTEQHGSRCEAESRWVGTVRPVAEAGELSRVADTASTGSFPGTLTGIHSGKEGAGSWDGEPKRSGADDRLDYAECNGRGARQNDDTQHDGQQSDAASNTDRPGPTNGHWRDADWLFCRDGKWRPVEPDTFPLVNGATSRVGRLRAYGNAIVPQVAQAFIEAFLEVRP